MRSPSAVRCQTTTLNVSGMDCAEEGALIDCVLKPLRGVREVSANLLAATIAVTHDARVTPLQLIDAIAPTGLRARQT
jgi:copper chaperone CopZ